MTTSDEPWPERDRVTARFANRQVPVYDSETPHGDALTERELHEPLKPLYTEKLPTSPAFKTVAELAQRRRDFWSKIVARGGIAMMVAAPVIAVWKGTGTIPAGAFVAGLIIFAAVCFINGNCRSRA